MLNTQNLPSFHCCGRLTKIGLVQIFLRLFSSSLVTTYWLNQIFKWISQCSINFMFRVAGY